jgi:transcriptional regulator with XRE-family HTH domain
MSEYDLDPLSDQQILARLAERLRHERLERNITQQALADLAGVGVATLRRFEGGEGNLSLLNLIAVLRALGLVSLLDALLRAPDVSPMASLREKGAGIYQESSVRQRARPESTQAGEKEGWSWGDDE